MARRSVAGRCASVGARRVAEHLRVAAAVAAAVEVAETASTAASQGTCHESVRSPRNPESLAVVVAAAAVEVAEIASTAASRAICLASVRSPRNPESLVAAVVVAAAASTAANLVTCPESALSQGSLERPRGLAADLPEWI